MSESKKGFIRRLWQKITKPGKKEQDEQVEQPPPQAIEEPPASARRLPEANRAVFQQQQLRYNPPEQESSVRGSRVLPSLPPPRPRRETTSEEIKVTLDLLLKGIPATQEAQPIPARPEAQTQPVVDDTIEKRDGEITFQILVPPDTKWRPELTLRFMEMMFRSTVKTPTLFEIVLQPDNIQWRIAIEKYQKEQIRDALKIVYPQAEIIEQPRLVRKSEYWTEQWHFLGGYKPDPNVKQVSKRDYDWEDEYKAAYWEYVYKTTRKDFLLPYVFVSDLRSNDLLTNIVEIFSQLEDQEEIIYQLALYPRGYKKENYQECYRKMDEYLMHEREESTYPLFVFDVRKPISEEQIRLRIETEAIRKDHEERGILSPTEYIKELKGEDWRTEKEVQKAKNESVERKMVSAWEKEIKEYQSSARKIINHWEQKSNKDLRSVKLTIYLRVDDSKESQIKRQFEAILGMVQNRLTK